MQIACLLFWALALYRIAIKVEKTEKVMPNKQIFIVHGVLITVYLLNLTISILMSFFGRSNVVVLGTTNII